MTNSGYRTFCRSYDGLAQLHVVRVTWIASPFVYTF